MVKDSADKTNILSEHNRVVSARHILALVNFIAIFAGTVITLAFTAKRGCPDGILAHLYILLAINIVQIILCVVDYVLKRSMGLYFKWLPYVSYAVGGLWLLTLAGELTAGILDLGAMRLDLIVIAAIQLIVAIVAYVVWPALDRKAIDAMIRPSVRESAEKRYAKSRKSVASYVFVCVAVVLLQGLGLMAYKIPPRPYDLFAASRAIKYELTEDGTGYIVKSVYRGTSAKLNIPAYYNDKPVVGIASGALAEDGLLDKYKISEITIGSEVTLSDGTTAIESNLEYIESGAIKNDKVESLTLPASVKRIGKDAISGSSLKVVSYQAAADFDIAYLDCDNLSEIIMEGSSVGNIVSLDGMSHDVLIRVRKDIYNKFRKNNMDYIHSFEPILDETEFCIDFYTDCDYYINSIFGTKGKVIELSYTDLKNSEISGIGIAEDTLRYIRNNHETGFEGVKADSAFRGWYYNAAFTDECEFEEGETVAFTSDTSLYAKWINEYTGTFDWGTYMPDGATEKMYWTDEDVVKFPVVTGRSGYSDGIVWTENATGKSVTDSRGISQNVTLNGAWILDKPTIDINPQTTDSGITVSQSRNEVTFMYDESRNLPLAAEYTHPLNNLQYKGQRTYYEFSWSKQNAVFSDSSEVVTLNKVADSGVYTLTVRTHSPYGEVSEDSTSITVTINRKTLNIGTMAMADASYEYDRQGKSILASGALPANSNIQVTYSYYDQSGNYLGVSNVYQAGVYTVSAYFEKNNSDEKANYETVTKTVTLTITKRQLTYGGWVGVGSGWTDNTRVYDGVTHTVGINLVGTVAGDAVNISYSGNSAKNVGNYKAEVLGVDNVNYTLENIPVNNLSYSWHITQKEVSVLRWELDGNSSALTSVTYDGKTHNVSAVLSGTANGETVSFVYNSNTPFVNSAINAGSYKAQIIGVNNTNYKFDTTQQNAVFDWTVEQRKLAVAYSATNTFTYSGSAYNITATVSNIVSEDLSSFALSDFAATGNYDELKGATSAGNYVLTFSAVNAGTYTANINGLGGAAQKALLGNYSLTAVTRTFTVNPKAVSASVYEQSHTYNGTQFNLYVDISGIVASDLQNVTLNMFTTNGAVSGAADSGNYRLTYHGTAAGEYTLEVSKFSDANYTFTAFSGKTAIAKKALTASWRIDGALVAGASVVYNGSQRVATANPSGVVTGDTVLFTVTSGTATDVGSYTSVASLDSSYTNYTFAGSSYAWKITAYTLNFTWSFNNTVQSVATTPKFVYSGVSVNVEPRYTALGTDVLGVTYASGANELTGVDVKNYSVKISALSGTKAGNYTLGTNTEFTWSITPATLNVSWNAASNLVYSGNYQGPSFTLVGFVGSTLKAGSTVTLATTSSVNGSYGTSTKTVTLTGKDTVYSLSGSTYGFAVDAGTYTVKVSSINDANYVLGVSSIQTFDIAQAAISLTGEWKYGSSVYSSPLTYAKSEFTLTTAINSASLKSRLGSTQDSVQLVYSVGSVSGSVKVSNKGTNVGDYKAEVSGISGTYSYNYYIPETANGKTLSWKITAKALTLTWDSTTKTYNALNQSMTALSATGLCTGDTLSSVGLIYANATGKAANKTYITTVTWSNNNYTIDNPTVTWTIQRAVITAFVWSGNSYTYNGAVQVPTASYTLSGETVSATAYSGNTAVKNAGSYSVTLTALNNDNYEISSTANVTCAFTINPRVITLQWNNISGVTYDTTKSYSATAAITNLCVGDAVTLGYQTKNSANTVVSNTVSNAGTYTVSVTGISGTASGNYTLSGTTNLSGGSVTIAQQKASVTWTGAGTFVYDGAQHSLTATVKGAVNIAVNVAFVGGTAAGTNVGEYTATVTLSDVNGNYTLDGVSNTSNKITITAQPVKVSWLLDSSALGTGVLTYDGLTHALSATAVGATDGKSVAVKTYSGIVSGKSVGTYNASVASLDDANYTLTGATGASTSFTVAPRKITLSWAVPSNVEYDGAAHYATATITNLCSGDTVNFTYSYNRNGTVSTSATVAGTYTVTVTAISGTSASNYTIIGVTNLSNTLTIKQRALSFTWNTPSSAVYSGSAYTVTATPSNIVSGQTLSLTYAYVKDGIAVGGAVAAGAYTVSVSGISGTYASNYTLTGATGNSATFVISQATVTASGTSPSDLKEGVTADSVLYAVNVALSGTLGKNVNAVYELRKDGVKYTASTLIAGEYTVVVTSLTGTDAANFVLTGNGTVAVFTVETLPAPEPEPEGPESGDDDTEIPATYTEEYYKAE